MAESYFNRAGLITVLVCLMITSEGFAATGSGIELSQTEKDWIEENHIVRVRVADWPPFQFYDNGFKGISVEYIKKILTIHGISYEFVSAEGIPWNKALEHIRNHEKVDLLLTAKITEDRRKYMAFTDEYLSLPWVIFTRTDSLFISGVEDLRGATVSVPEGFVMHELLKNNYPEINLRLVTEEPAVETCLELLAEGQVDAYIGNLSVGSYIMLNKGLNNLKVAAPTPFGSHNQAMAIRDDWPELAGIINKTLQSFSHEEHAEIRNRWLSVRYEHGLRFQDILKWVLTVTALFSILLILYTLWNRRLQLEIKGRKRAERELLSSEQRYKNLSEAAFEGVLFVEERVIRDANRAAMEMFGYDREELIGKDVETLIHPDDRDVFNREIYGQRIRYEISLITKDGRKFPVDVHVKKNIKNDRKTSIVALRDLTDIRRADEEIRTLQGILPICSHCRQIRDDKGYWNSLEDYMTEHNIADFSHSLCPRCAEELYPELDLGKKKDPGTGQ